MTNTPKAEEPLLACKVCMKDIPESVGKSPEAEDYVQHFCGIECFSEWEKRNDASNDTPQHTNE